MNELSDPLVLGRASARNRIVFGPHETNLGRGRSLSDAHVAYYEARAAGGAGVIITEEASVDESDWPYERAPLARQCGPGWRAVSDRCHLEGSLVFAALGHAGGQGASAYHLRALLAPSAVADVSTREMPKAMEEGEIEAVVAAFGTASRLAVASGCDGVEVNAGQWSLLRQFLSPLTNERTDRYGSEPALFLVEVLRAVRDGVGTGVVGLRFSTDELAPWAGLVPETAAAALKKVLAATGAVDYVTVVRGSAYGVSATRPDCQEGEGFNLPALAVVRAACPPPLVLVAQGSIVEPALSRRIVHDGFADAVEMTRAQIADPRLARKVTAGDDGAVRPCVLCNQQCQVRDVRNPVVSCIGEPSSGHEREGPGEPSPPLSPRSRRRLLVVGGGPAGLECARVAALLSVPVLLVERSEELGGMVTKAAARLPGRARLARLTTWLERECRRLGVAIHTGHPATRAQLDGHAGPVVIASGSRPGRRTYSVEAPERVKDVSDFLADGTLPMPEGNVVVVWDPIGGPEGVGTAELIARESEVDLVTPDFVAGGRLARCGDLAPAGVRLARLGARVSPRSVVRLVAREGVWVEDRYTGAKRLIKGAVLVDAGHRLPEDSLAQLVDPSRRCEMHLVGDAVAPRTIHEAVLEGRRAALSLVEGGPVSDGGLLVGRSS